MAKSFGYGLYGCDVFWANSLLNYRRIQLHYYTLVDQLIDNQDHTCHVVDQALSRNIVLKHLVEAIMDSVEDGG